MSTSPDILAIFEEAKEKHLAATHARKEMASVMLRAFQRLISSGSVLDLRFSKENPPPPYLARVRTMRGNDRGTKVFRIVNVVAVEVDPIHPDLSTWIADAVPISEKTGKDMKASTGHGNNQDTVRLHGNVGCEFNLDEPTSAAANRVIDLVAQHCAMTDV